MLGRIQATGNFGQLNFLCTTPFHDDAGELRAVLRTLWYGELSVSMSGSEHFQNSLRDRSFRFCHIILQNRRKQWDMNHHKNLNKSDPRVVLQVNMRLFRLIGCCELFGR